VLPANLLLYGPGALLIRELKDRWRKGWLAVFILAVAYVVAEEGLMLNQIAPKILLPGRGVNERLKDTLCQKSYYRCRNG
jgi:hypothetical protein